MECHGSLGDNTLGKKDKILGKKLLEEFVNDDPNFLIPYLTIAYHVFM